MAGRPGGRFDSRGRTALGLLDDRVCLVTGAGQGLGRSVSLEMAREGATVVLLERNADTAASVEDEIRAAGGNASRHALDVTDYDRFGEVVADVIGRLGRIDVVVN